jgi:hypothetical protein
MKMSVSLSHALAMPFLLPGNLACRAAGVTRQRDLIRMLINSLFWTVLGIVVVVLAV